MVNLKNMLLLSLVAVSASQVECGDAPDAPDAAVPGAPAPAAPGLVPAHAAPRQAAPAPAAPDAPRRAPAAPDAPDAPRQAAAAPDAPRRAPGDAVPAGASVIAGIGAFFYPNACGILNDDARNTFVDKGWVNRIFKQFIAKTFLAKIVLPFLAAHGVVETVAYFADRSEDKKSFGKRVLKFGGQDTKTKMFLMFAVKAALAVGLLNCPGLNRYRNYVDTCWA